MLALSPLGSTVTAILFVLSFIAFVLAAVGWTYTRWSTHHLVALGLALWMFVLAWNAVAVT